MSPAREAGLRGQEPPRGRRPAPLLAAVPVVALAAPARAVRRGAARRAAREERPAERAESRARRTLSFVSWARGKTCAMCGQAAETRRGKGLYTDDRLGQRVDARCRRAPEKSIADPT